jgi:hypothetical protein
MINPFRKILHSIRGEKRKSRNEYPSSKGKCQEGGDGGNAEFGVRDAEWEREKYFYPMF